MAARNGQRAGSRPSEIRRRDLVAVCALVLPLVLVLPGGLFPYELPKLAGCGVAVVLAAAATARGALPRSVRWLLIGGAVLLTLAALLSADPLLALIGSWPRYQGAIALPLFAGAAWAGARLLGPDAPPRQRDAFLAAVAVAMVLNAVVAGIEATGLRPIAGDAADRTGALLGTATDLGFVGAMGAVLLLGALLEDRARWRTCTIGLAAAGVAIVLAASRGGYLALGVGAALLAGHALLRRRWRAAVTTAGATAVVAVAGLLVPTTAARLTGGTALARDTVANRGLLWEESVRLLLHSGPLGVGPSGFAAAILRFHTATWGSRVGFDAAVDSPHSVVLQAAAAGGPLLVLGGIALTVLTAIAGFRGGAWPAACACAALAGVAGLLTSFPTSGTAPLLAVLLGAVVAGGVRRDRRAVRWAWAIVAGTLALATLLGGIAEVPLRVARDAAQHGHLTAFASSVSVAEALRPWDPAVDSIAAQTAVQASEGRGGAAFLPVAIRTARRSLVLAPHDHDTLTALAVALQAREEDRAALPLWNTLIAQAPADADLRIRRLVSRARTGNLAGAIRDGQRALQLDPGNTIARRDLQLLQRGS